MQIIKLCQYIVMQIKQRSKDMTVSQKNELMEKVSERQNVALRDGLDYFNFKIKLFSLDSYESFFIEWVKGFENERGTMGIVDNGEMFVSKHFVDWSDGRLIKRGREVCWRGTSARKRIGGETSMTGAGEKCRWSGKWTKN